MVNSTRNKKRPGRPGIPKDRKIIKSVWISFDLGLTGDYETLYAWLDNNSAKECGDNLALIKYEVSDKDDLASTMKRDIEESMELKKKDRIYIIYRSYDGKIKCCFLFGSRKQSPWTGYASLKDQSSDESES